MLVLDGADEARDVVETTRTKMRKYPVPGVYVMHERPFKRSTIPPPIRAPVKLEFPYNSSSESLATRSTPGSRDLSEPKERGSGSVILHEDDIDDGTGYPKSWRLASIMTALCLAVFCMALDQTIIATAIPKITDHFKALEDVAWYGSAYLLTTCGFQLFFGRLYSFFSIKWVFLSAVFLFELGSLLCGIAPSSVALIVGRAVAGIGSSGLFSGGILIIAHSVPLRQRPIYTGVVGAMYGIASVAGPLLGGVFTDHLTWRWCFYINLPIGAVTVIFILLFFKSPNRREVAKLTWKEKLVKLDLPGTAIFIPSVVCLLLALQWGGSTYPWSDARVIALFVVFGVLTLIFILVQWRQQENGTVPPRIFLMRSVLSATWFAFMFGGSFFILIYYVPIWFQAIKGASATTSGIDSLPLVLAVSVFSVIGGVGISVLGLYGPWMVASTVCMALGSGLITTFQVDTRIAKWLGYQVIAGAGFGMGIQTPLIVVQTILSLDDVPTGIAIIMFWQTLGGAVFIAVAQNVFLNKLSANVSEFIPGFDVKLLFTTGATTLKSLGGSDLLVKILSAYNKALDETFYVATALAALSIVGAVCVEWKSVKGQGLLMAGA